MYAFKMNRNQTRLIQHISKQFTYTNPDEPGYSDELAQKFKTVEIYQLIAQAVFRGLLTDQEAQDIQKIDPIRRRQILAQSTVESVTAFQLALRQKRKDELADPSISQEKLDFINHKIDQIILLKDFPKSAEDVKVLVKYGMQKFHGGFLIEEIFSRELESDDEDTNFNSQSTVGILQSVSKSQYSSTQLNQEVEQDGKKLERKYNTLSQRAQIFEEFILINRIAKKQKSESEIVNFYVKKHKFQGPENPLDIPPPPEDGQEQIPVDEELKAQQFKYYQDFALYFKQEVESISKNLFLYKNLKKIALQNQVQLRPKPFDPEEEQKKQQRQEEQKKLQAERAKQEEEEKKAAEANVKGGQKKSANTKQRNSNMPSNLSKDVDDDLQGKTIDKTEPDLDESPIFFSLDDDPTKTWEFNQYQKNMRDVPMGTCTVGTILGAIVNQLSQPNPQDSMKPEFYIKNKITKKISSAALKSKMNSQINLAKAEENIVNEIFQSALLKLSIDHSIIETDYKHQFDYNLIDGDAKIKSSPYMIVKSQNDKMLYNSSLGAYLFGDGTAQDYLESKILQNSQIPGVNNRQGMPEKATQKQAVRQSDQNQIIKFCQLPSAQTKRCLILRGCEDMMKKQLKEREFSFLDRNYVEEYNDKNTLRQVLSNAITQLRPEILTEYFEMDDGLLISLYYKNPPGRLLRRQWTQPPLVFPNFSEWFNHLLTSVDSQSDKKLDQLLKNRKQEFLDISIDKVGAIKNNTKFMFPSDNSIIRVEKHQVGQKRMGETLILKDNFVFGLSEKKQIYDLKVDGEEEIRNRDYKKKQDKRCELWLSFENGTRMTVEMQDHLEANMTQLPPFKIQNWLIKKIEREEKLKKQQEEESDELDNIATERQNLEYAPSTTSNNMNQTSFKIEQSPKADSKMENLNQTANSNNGIERKSAMDQDEQPEKKKSLKDEKSESEILEEEDSEMLEGSLIFEGQNDLTKGAKISFTFNDGLVVQVLPNGDVLQQIINDPLMPKNLTKGNNLVQNQQTLPGQEEVMRVITMNGDIIKHIEDGNFIIYMSDGTITYSDKRRGIWYTISLAGVKRERKIKNRIIKDDSEKLRCQKKIDPETNAQLTIREDGLLNIVYLDQTQLIIMPDGTNILKKKRSDGEAGTVTIISKDKFAPVRQIYDPVKARARTIIGMGGTDALMGKDQIMERSNTGRISEVLLPDKTIVQSYFEKQELEGYNLFSQNMVHIIRRDDFSVVKVRQDGEVVLITANERAYLNEIGKQIEEFGSKDYDYFFELFGIANERRSGVYTCNLDQGKIWTEDEEGNFFIVYANGDSVEKMSVSFNLDQMVDGIEYKEPESPRMLDGEFMEDECKFLPPPKSMAHPRLFYVRNDGTGCEFFNEEQSTHMFRTFHKQKDNQDLIQSQNLINQENEECIKHVFIQKQNKHFNAQAFDVSNEFPKLPQSLEMVNQTVSIPTEPVVEHYTIQNFLQFKKMDQEMINEFNQALYAYKELKEKQSKMEKVLKIVEPHIVTIAAATLSEKEGKMRSTGVNSNLNQSNNFLNPGSDGGLSESFMLQNSISPKMRSPRNQKDNSRNQPNDLMKNKITEESSTLIQEEIYQDDIQIDPESGLQIYKNEMNLTFLQKLQLRIIQERNINLSNLMGEEFQPLKQFKKLEERGELLNNVYDFFDQKFENSFFSLNENQIELKQKKDLNSGQPSAMFLSISSQKEIM